MPIYPITPESLEKAMAALRLGQVIALPTETVYGLVADAGNAAAVAALYALKGREETKPCQVLVGSSAAAFGLGEFSPAAQKLAAAFWPGALTLVVARKSAGLAENITPGATVGIRVPDHGVTQELLRKLAFPLAASSANPAGAAPACTAEEVAAYFPELLVLDGDIRTGGTPSTVADCTGPEIKVLREGALSASALRAAYR